VLKFHRSHFLRRGRCRRQQAGQGKKARNEGSRDFIKPLPSHPASERKLELFLTALAKEGVASSTQNQAFNAMVD
jgi:hypothetical protein